MKSDNTNSENAEEHKDVIKEWEAIKSKFSWTSIKFIFEPEWLRAWLATKIINVFSSIFFWVILAALGVFAIYFSYVAHPGTLVAQKIQSEIRNIVGSIFADLPTATDKWGQLGDFFGGVLNPVIGLATIYLLVQSVTLQRRELAATRIAMEETKDEMKDQSTQMKLQSFESTFFTWLGTYRSHVTSFEVGSRESVEGLNRVLSLLISNFETDAHSLAIGVNSADRESAELSKRFYSSWLNTLDRHQHFLYPIINNFLELIKWVDANVYLTPLQRDFYINLIVAQLSIGELKLILLFSKMKTDTGLDELCIKYNVLRNLPTTSFALKFLLDARPHKV